MAKQPGVWGIDLGQCALKALRLDNLDGQATATAFDYVEHPKILSQPDADPDQLIREALEKFLSRNSLRGDTVAISVPGQSGLARFVKLPPVEEKKIVDIVRFEAKQQIPFNLEEVVWDYQKISSGSVSDGFAMDTEIGLFAIKRDIINHALQHFTDVNVEVHIVQMAPLALCNFVSHELLHKEEGAEVAPGKKQCIVALDIGADSSNLVITDGGRIIWQRHIPLGGNHFTRALTKDLKLTFAKAEHLKRNATKSVDKNIDLKKILAALKPVLNDFVGEVQRSLGYFTNTHRDAQIEYMVGLGSAFRLPGLQRFLGEKLQLDVRKLTKLERLAGDSVLTQPAFAENVMSFAVAYGLALQGMKLSRIQTNLLPPEIQIDRMVRAKKPWAAAAAACLLLGAGGLSVGYALDYRAYGAAPVVKAVDDAVKSPSGPVALAAKGVADWNAEDTKVKAEEKAVKSIVAGQEEKLNWLELNKFINTCMPRPDASNLRWNRVFRSNYWTVNAQRAYDKWLQRQAGAKEDKDDGLAYLVQCNLEAVNCRYGDLGSFWTTLKGRPEFANGIPFVRGAEAAEGGKDIKPPEGKGWVVELRGYTYNQGKQGFVLESLVANIAHEGIKTPPKAAEAAPAAAAATPATPPVPQTPSTGGAAPAPAAEATVAKNEGPVIDKVSHIVLYRFETDPAASLIGGTGLNELVTSAAPAGGGDAGSTMPGGGAGTNAGNKGSAGMGAMGGMGGMMGMMGGGGGWMPLGSGGGGATSAPGENRGMMGGAGGSFKPPVSGPPGGGGEAAPNPAEATSKVKHARTEFVIVFVWREPTPSDDLLDKTEEAPPAAGGGGMPSSGGAPGGGGSAAPPPSGGGGGTKAGGGLDDMLGKP